ncbi:unnamed protein product [Ophioblennius macclurei]
MYQNLQKNLEGLNKEQEREWHMLEKALEHLNTLISLNSLKPSTESVKDGGIQTSPLLLQTVLNIMQKNKHEGAPQTLVSENLEQIQAEVSPQHNGSITRMRKNTRKTKKRLKMWPVKSSQRSNSTKLDENSQPFVNKNKRHPTKETRKDSLSPLKIETRARKAAGCFITPHYWSQESNSPIGLQDVKPIVEKLSSECNAALARPVGFWQLFETNDSEGDP